MKYILCILLRLHAWRNDDIQSRYFNYETCGRCGKHRVLKKECFKQ